MKLNEKQIQVAVVCGVIAAIILAYITNPESMIRRGDFPGMYVLPYIIKNYGVHQIYDYELQREIQNQLWPSFQGGYLRSAYPPFYGYLLLPLAYIPHQAAQLLFIAVNFSALMLVSCFFIRLNVRLSANYYIALMLSAPMFVGLFGGQNSGLTLLCAVSSIWLIQSSRQLEAGLVTAFWCYKPQFAILFFAYNFLITRSYNYCIGFLVGALMLYLLTAIPLGFEWPVVWLDAIRRFAEHNFSQNSELNISIFGIASYVTDSAVIGVIIVASLAYYFIKFWWCPKAEQLLYLSPAIAAILSPQTLFYDMGLILISLILIAPPKLHIFILWAFMTQLASVYCRPFGAFPLLSLLLLALPLLKSRVPTQDPKVSETLGSS